MFVSPGVPGWSVVKLYLSKDDTDIYNLTDSNRLVLSQLGAWWLGLDWRQVDRHSSNFTVDRPAV